jgi:RNA polymerase sigma-70 factor (ECF subfamily)
MIREQRDPALKDMLGSILDRADAQKLFEALSENQRQTLILFFFEGFTLDEIALKLGQTRGNIKNHYFRGLEKLRKLLQCVPQRNSAV